MPGNVARGRPPAHDTDARHGRRGVRMLRWRAQVVLRPPRVRSLRTTVGTVVRTRPTVPRHRGRHAPLCLGRPPGHGPWRYGTLRLRVGDVDAHARAAQRGPRRPSRSDAGSSVRVACLPVPGTGTGRACLGPARVGRRRRDGTSGADSGAAHTEAARDEVRRGEVGARSGCGRGGRSTAWEKNVSGAEGRPSRKRPGAPRRASLSKVVRVRTPIYYQITR